MEGCERMDESRGFKPFSEGRCEARFYFLRKFKAVAFAAR